jgi:hypothetical protein
MTTGGPAFGPSAYGMQADEFFIEAHSKVLVVNT